MKRLIVVIIVAMVGMVLPAAPTVTDVVAKQRYPWNGLVDITCKVTGIEKSAPYKFYIESVHPEEGISNTLSQFWVVQDGTKQSDFKVTANDDYHLIWDAKADLGSIRCTNMIVCVALKGMVQLWEGGPYWATTNIGAEQPEDYGYYFWWGDTVGYKRENDKWVASDGSNSNFSFGSGSTPTYGKSVSTLKSEGWITADGVLASKHDAAQAHLGSSWRMPTKAELDALNSNCDWTWTTTNGVNGYIVRGRGEYASNSIFLPCAGVGGGTSLYFAGSYGYYWSSVPNSVYNNSWSLYFYSGHHGTDFNDRFGGRSVRPVSGFTK